MSFKPKLYCNTLSCKMGYTVKGVMRMLTARFDQEGIDLTLEQYFILNILDNEEGLILKDLAKIVHRDKSAVYRHICGLEENHFIARTADAEDKRRKILFVTKPGMRVLKQARSLDKKVNNEVTQSVGEKQLEEFGEVLNDMYEHVQRKHEG